MKFIYVICVLILILILTLIYYITIKKPEHYNSNLKLSIKNQIFNKSSSSKLIPKIIHQTWYTNILPKPIEDTDTRQQMLKLHSDYEYKFYNEMNKWKNM